MIELDRGKVCLTLSLFYSVKLLQVLTNITDKGGKTRQESFCTS